jgi:hypothetical protein
MFSVQALYGLTLAGWLDGRLAGWLAEWMDV